MRGLQRAQTVLRACSYDGLAISSSPSRSALGLRATAPSSSSSSTARGPTLTTTSTSSPRALTPLAALLPLLLRRPFSQTTLLGAKKHREKVKKAAAAEARDDEWGEDQLPSESRRKARDKFHPSSDFEHESAFDLRDVDAEYARVDERFEKKLQEFKASGGRFNPDVLGQLRVRPDRDSAQAYPLHELASVVHRGGRTVSIMVSDAAYVKPIMSAVQNSADFNQQPQRDPDNDLELVLRVEPENPDEQAKRLKGECNAWKDAVREVLATRKSKHAAWQKAKHLTRDDVKNLDKMVKAKQDKKIEAIEKREKQLQVELANRQKRL